MKILGLLLLTPLVWLVCAIVATRLLLIKEEAIRLGVRKYVTKNMKLYVFLATMATLAIWGLIILSGFLK